LAAWMLEDRSRVARILKRCDDAMIESFRSLQDRDSIS
jgi:hypothetical protein